MNIKDFWPTEPVEHSVETWRHLLELRKKTFLGFLSIEDERGFLKPCSLHTSKGQEMIRILLFRFFEELVESIDATDELHQKEEIIDAFNFMYGVYYLDEDLFSKLITPERLMLLSSQASFNNRKLSVYDIGLLIVNIGIKIGDLLRNRAWMNTPQDLYYSGVEPMVLSFEYSTEKMFSCFSSFEEFAKYFIAKDAVLQFRLRSKY